MSGMAASIPMPWKGFRYKILDLVHKIEFLGLLDPPRLFVISRILFNSKHIHKGPLPSKMAHILLNIIIDINYNFRFRARIIGDEPNEESENEQRR
jgi:hypothetical protein